MKGLAALLAFAGASMPPAAHAGPVLEFVISGEALRYMDNGVLASCGVRLIGMPLSTEGLVTAPILDVSFNVTTTGHAVIDGGLMKMPVQDMQARDFSNTAEVPIKALWLKASGSVRTQPSIKNGKPLPSETRKRALMYPTRVGPVMDLAHAALDKKQIQVGFQILGQEGENIYFGTVQLTPSDRRQFSACLAEWNAAVQPAGAN